MPRTGRAYAVAVPETTDVVVVGGGVVGCACARELARRGVEVVLVERAELAAGASGRNHGLILAPSEPALGDMAGATLAVYEELAQDAAVPFRLDPEPIGYLVVAGQSDEERRRGRAEAEVATEAGVAVERLDAQALRELEPGLAPDLTEGWLLHDGRRVDPGALTVALAHAARVDGSDIRHHLAARVLTMTGDRVTGVVTDDGPIAAGAVVVAAGPWSNRLLESGGMGIPITAARGWLVHLRPHAPILRRIVERAGWHLLPDDEGLLPLRGADVAAGPADPVMGTLLHPGADGTVTAGASRHVPVVEEPEDHDVPRRIVRRAATVLPGLAEAAVLQAWWGMRPMTPDGRPVVGPVADGLIVATGHGSQGVILAGGTGALVAATIADGDAPFDPAPFSPARFA